MAGKSKSKVPNPKAQENTGAQKRKLHPALAIIYRVLRVAAIAYLALLVFYFVAQRSMLYYPTKTDLQTDKIRAAAEGLQPLLDGKGFLIGWRSTNPEAPIRALVLHGNAGSALNRTYYTKALRFKNPAWDVSLLEYPGYGARPGSPSEETLVDAGIVAVDQLMKEDSRPLILIGESIGSGVAARVAAARPNAVSGLIMVTPFDSLVPVARNHFRWLPVQWLLRDRYNSSEALSAFNKPTFVMVAEQDEIIPPWSGVKLFESLPGPKELYIEPGAGHNTWNTLPNATWWEAAKRFLSQNIQSKDRE